jgi:hypothetical protein
MKKYPQIFCIKNPNFQTQKRKLRSKNELLKKKQKDTYFKEKRSNAGRI